MWNRLVLLLLCAGVASAAQIRVISENYPPFNYPEGESLVGVSAALVAEIRKRVGDEGPVLIWPWTKGYAAVQAEPNTALFSTTLTPERQDLFQWVGPLVHNRWALFAKADSKITLPDLAAAKAYTIGTYKDDAVDQYLRSQGFGDEQLKAGIDDRLNGRKLLEGRIDLWAGGEIQIPFKLRQFGGHPSQIKVALVLQETELYIAFSKGTDPALVAQWQGALDAMRADGRYAAILAEHEIAAE
ncbi:MAG: ABC transporter substrate-binding protein [Planctomycetota bacterium]|jgi:polar amino acid transport system substrate-binding protein|nr:ABC transporter substrate-binding protein [Planctomycetota bacterium]